MNKSILSTESEDIHHPSLIQSLINPSTNIKQERVKNPFDGYQSPYHNDQLNPSEEPIFVRKMRLLPIRGGIDLQKEQQLSMMRNGEIPRGITHCNVAITMLLMDHYRKYGSYRDATPNWNENKPVPVIAIASPKMHSLWNTTQMNEILKLCKKREGYCLKDLDKNEKEAMELKKMYYLLLNGVVPDDILIMILKFRISRFSVLIPGRRDIKTIQDPLSLFKTKLSSGYKFGYISEKICNQLKEGKSGRGNVLKMGLMEIDMEKVENDMNEMRLNGMEMNENESE